MIVFRTQVKNHVSITRKEGRYMTSQQASLASDAIGVAVGFTEREFELAYDFLRGKLAIASLHTTWPGSPAELDSLIGLHLWFSLAPVNETHTLKKAYIVFSNNSQSLCDRSVVFTTKRIIPMDPITKDLASQGYARYVCTEMYVDAMREQYPQGYMPGIRVG